MEDNKQPKKKNIAPAITVADIKDLVQDQKNFNKGSEFGDRLMTESFQKFGAGRSVLIDKNNRLISGNKSSAKFGELGGENVVIVDADPNTLIAVRRKDLDLDTPEGREFALADNATAKANIVWAEDIIAETVGVMEAQTWGVYVAPTNFEGDGNDLPPIDSNPGGGKGAKTPKISDDRYSSFEVIMEHENKLKLIEAIDEVRLRLEMPTMELALMEILHGYQQTLK